jgi:hypothetical protein
MKRGSSVRQGVPPLPVVHLLLLPLLGRDRTGAGFEGLRLQIGHQTSGIPALPNDAGALSLPVRKTERAPSDAAPGNRS